MINDVVKFIRVKALNHRHFQNFLTAEWEADYADVIYYCDVRRLVVLRYSKELLNKKTQSKNSCLRKINEVSNLIISSLWQILHFSLIYFFPNLATVNLKLQQRGQLIHVLFSYAKAFQAKLKLFEQ